MKRTKALEQFGIHLGLIARLWRSEVDRRMSRHQITQARWLTLLHLSRMTPPVRQAALAASLGVQGPTLVRILDRLESDRLIRRCVIRGDRRARSIRLTARAAPVLSRIHAVAERLREEIFAGIAERDLLTCLRVFEQVIARLEPRSSGRAVARPRLVASSAII